MQPKSFRKRKHVPHIAEEGGEEIQKPAAAHLPPVVAPPAVPPPPPPPRDALLMLPQAYVRISSANRTPGMSRSNFSVILTQAIRRAIGFCPIHTTIYNTWPNISPELANNTFSITYSVGPVTSTRTITTGSWFLSATSTTFIEELNRLLDGVASPGEFEFGWDMPTNRLFLFRNTPSTNTLTLNLVGSTAATLMGITANVVVNASDTPFYLGAQAILTDYPTVSVGSSQLRMPVSVDSKRDGSKNAFLNIPNVAGKGSYLTYHNPAPTALSIIRLPSPSDFSQISLELFDPRTGLEIPLATDWEIQVLFVLAPAER